MKPPGNLLNDKKQEIQQNTHNRKNTTVQKKNKGPTNTRDTLEGNKDNQGATIFPLSSIIQPNLAPENDQGVTAEAAGRIKER